MMSGFRSTGNSLCILLMSIILLVASAASGQLDKPSGSAVLKKIAILDDGSLEVEASSPIAYTFYKMDTPDRAVIDLAFTTLGSVAVADVNPVGVFGPVSVAEHKLNGGVLTRIEVVLEGKSDFIVLQDRSEHSKIKIVATSPQGGDDKISTVDQHNMTQLAAASSGFVSDVAGKDNSAVKSQSVAHAVADVAAQPVQTSTDVPIQPISMPTSSKQLTEGSEKTCGESARADRGSVVTGIRVSDAGIVIESNGPLLQYNTFKLSKPDRVVIDLPRVKNCLRLSQFKVSAFSVGNVRIGSYNDKTRLVFDASDNLIPPHTIDPNTNGLLVRFVPSELHQSSELKVTQTTSTPEKRVSDVITIPVAKSVGVIEAVDFIRDDAVSRISIKTSDNCQASDPVPVHNGIQFTITNCKIPKRLQRTLDTSAFASEVLEISPYPIKTKTSESTRVFVRLRRQTPYTYRHDHKAVVMEIPNPEQAQTPVLSVSSVAATPASTFVSSDSQPMPVAARPVDVPVAQNPTQQGQLTVKTIDRKVYTGRKVTLEFADADIRKIFQLIAEVSSLNFLIGDDVSGTISIKLVNVPWDQALDVILDAKGLGMKRDGNIVVIKPKDKIKTLAEEELAITKAIERAGEIKTRAFDVNYASIGDVATQFKALSSERGIINPDPRTNRVIVSDIEPKLILMSKLLRELDIPEKQVMIEARIVEATSDFSRDLGVQWGIHYVDGSASLLGISQFDTSLGGVVTPVPSSGFSSTAGGQAGLSFGKLNSNIKLDLRLSAAATEGLVKIISTPKVMTLNNKAAKISQGQQIPFETTSQNGTNVQLVKAELSLEVTPHITSDGSVIMLIKAKNDAPGAAFGNGNVGINTKEATTELLLKNGETTVLGGIYVDNDNQTETGVPFLKDIPILGYAFKSNSKKKTRTELLIFITPKIVS